MFIAIVGKTTLQMFKLDSRTDVSGHVSEDLLVGEEVRLPLDHDVLHAADVVDLPGVQVQPGGPCEAAEPERVVGVGGADAGNSDAGLGEDLVDGESHHVLGLDGVDLVPLPVTKLERIFRPEGCSDRTAAIVHSELNSSVQHP